MSMHIDAQMGDIAPFVLLPGDPVRAKNIANEFLVETIQYSNVRQMSGLTGIYKGQRVSVQPSGMGTPSLSIYVNELIVDFGVKKIIRIGTAGAIKEHLSCGQIVIGMGACSDSNMNSNRFGRRTFCPIADPTLFMKACKVAQELGISYEVGNFFTSDFFYDPIKRKEGYSVKVFSDCHNVLAVEMETAELYTLGSLHNVQTLSICVISNNLITGGEMSSHEKENSFENACKIALALL